MSTNKTEQLLIMLKNISYIAGVMSNEKITDDFAFEAVTQISDFLFKKIQEGKND